jgi:folylpolyglutamate synthase/dihydropteroate synthase
MITISESDNLSILEIAQPAITAIAVFETYRSKVFSDQISMGIQETEYEIRIEIAAPTPLNDGTKRIKLTTNPIICRDPINNSLLDIPK